MGSQGTVTWGLDLSTDPRKCAAVAIQWDGGRPTVVEVVRPLGPSAILELITQNDAQFAVDVPFGWPDAFVAFLNAHQNSAQRPPLDREAWRKEFLARRATDARLAEVGAAPLPASFDRLGKTAVMWSSIEYDLIANGVAVDRSGVTGRVCETYPAAALHAWMLPKSKPSLAALEGAFPFLELGEEMRARLGRSDDARDALVCALAARAKTLALTVGPEDVEQARREGWIHVTHPLDPRALLGSDTGAWLSIELHVPTLRSLDEDGPKRSFDFASEDGSVVDDLAEFAAGGDLIEAAARIVNYPFPHAVPPGLSREAWALVSRR